MATIIDALLVTLGLDTSNFKKGAAEVAKGQKDIEKNAKQGSKEIEKAEAKLAAAQKQRAKEMEARAQAIARGFAKIRNEAIGLFAVFTAGQGIKSFVFSTITTAAGLGFLSQNLKKSTEEVQAWQRATERMGGSAEGIVSQMKESASEIAGLQNGLGPSDGMQWFLRMGGSVDALKDGNSYLLARADIIKKIFDTGDSAKAQMMASKMGISEDQYNFIKQGSAAILNLVEAQKKNSAISAKDAAGALELRNRWLDFSDAAAATSTRILVSLIPTFNKLMDWLQKVAEWIDEHRNDIAEWVEKGVTKLIPLLQSLGAAIASIDWKGVAGNLKTVAGAIGSIADGLKLVIDYVQRLQDAGAFKFINASPWGKLKMLKEAWDKSSDAGGSSGPYPPSVTSPPVTGGAAGGTSGVISQLMGLGWSQAQAAGLAANFMAESRLDPSAVGDGGKAYGIGQWHPDRQAAFKEKFGKDIRGSSLAEQVAFAHFELTAGNERDAGGRLSKANTAGEAAAIASRYYERPADADGEASKRAAMAAAVMATHATANATAAANIPMGAGASAGGPNLSVTPTSTTVHIGAITVETKATDAKGIAKDLGAAVTKHSFVNQANLGVS